MDLWPWNNSPYAVFDPSQYKDPYSNYQSGPLPGPTYQLPPGLTTPTDAMGNQIAMPPGMTINQPAPAPAQAAPAAAPQDNGQQALNMLLTQSALQSTPMGTPDGGGRGAYTGYGGSVFGAQLLDSLQRQRAAAQPIVQQTGPAILNALAQGDIAGARSVYGGGGQPAAASTSTPQQGAAGSTGFLDQPGPSGLTYNQVLQLLSNPGKVTTQGATVPQAVPGYEPSSGSALMANLSSTPTQPAPSRRGRG